MQNTVLLVDDHPVFRKGLRFLLEDEEDMKVVGEAGDGQEALALIEELSPDIVVMDVTMPGLSGIEATRRITSEFPDTAVVALSIHSEKQFVHDMLQAGASGYILKETVPEELINGIRSVMIGEGYLSPAITEIVVSQFRKALSVKQTVQKLPVEIIETKLHAPMVPEGHVLRARLVEFLKKNQRLPLQTIIAPAGYGKSTVVSCWFTKHKWSKSWLSLDKNDNNLRQFIIHFIHAVKAMFPNALSKTKSLVEIETIPPLQILATMLVNELNCIQHNFILVLDDVQLVSEKLVHDLLTELLRYPPPCMHLIILGRTDPFLPLNKLLAQGQLAEIRLNDLRFTERETAKLLKSILGRDVDESLALSLHRKTEGWVTGLRLAGLSIRHQSDSNRLLQEEDHGSDLYVKEYLFNEVLNQLPEHIRKHILNVSIVERFCAPLVTVLCPYSENECEFDGWGLIKWLKDNNLFLIPLDNEEYWYRFHHLFQELLEKQLQLRFGSEEVAALHTKVSSWLVEHGLIDDAIRHALSAGDIAAAVRLVEQNRIRILNNDQWYILQTWLSMLPEQSVQQRPKLLLAQIWVYYFEYNFAFVPQLIERLESIVSNNPKEQSLYGELYLFKGVFCYWRGDGRQGLKYIKTALLHIPEEDTMTRGFAEIYYALTGQAQGRQERIVHEFNELLLNDLALVRKSRLIIALAWIHLISGDLTVAASFNQLLQNTAVKGRINAFTVWSIYHKGIIHFQRNELHEAIHHFSQVEEIGDICLMLRRAQIDCMAGLALAYQTVHQSDSAVTTLERLSEYVNLLDDSTLLRVIESCKEHVSLLKGETVHSSSRLGMGHTLPHEPMTLWLEIPAITECRVLLAENTYAVLQVAEQRLQEILLLNRDHHNTFQMIQILPLLALCYTKQNRSGEALEIMKQAVNLAQPGGFVRPFIEPGPLMRDLLKELLEQQIAEGFVEKILAAFAEEKPGVVSQPPENQSKSFQLLADPLTNREQEILVHLAQGEKNKDIAENLFISLPTVKTHLKNIYQKLEVNSRLQAVNKAMTLGIVDRL